MTHTESGFIKIEMSLYFYSFQMNIFEYFSHMIFLKSLLPHEPVYITEID